MTSFTVPFGPSRTKLWRKCKLIETDESLPHNEQRTFRMFTSKKKDVSK